MRECVNYRKKLKYLKLGYDVLVGAAPGISASPSEENMRYFNVIILGPEQSPYEGNTFSQLQLYNHSIPIIICCHLVQTMLMLSIAYI